MSASTLAAKLKLGAGARALLINAPASYRTQLGTLPSGATLSGTGRGTFDWIQVFAKSRAELRRLAPRAVRALGSAGILWVSFPKGSSSIQTDLTRDAGWDSLRTHDLKWVTLVSVDQTWSAFAMRRYRPGEVRRSFK
jgi:hypothetical protein